MHTDHHLVVGKINNAITTENYSRQRDGPVALKELLNKPFIGKRRDFGTNHLPGMKVRNHSFTAGGSLDHQFAKIRK